MRTVGVRLKAQISEYVREMRTSKAETKSFKDELVEAGKRGEASATALGRGMGVARRAIDDVGDAADRAGDDLDELRRDAERLEGQIDETANAVRRLAREVITTSDAATRRSLVGDLAKQRAALRELTDLRKLIDVDTGKGIGEELASQVSVSFVQRLGPLIARAPMAGMNPAALAIGAPLAAGVATLIGTAAGGAIIGGTAGLGIVGGLKIAARHPAVKREAGELKEEIASVFEDAAVAFVPETLDAIDTIRVRLRDLEPELRQVFTASSRYVDPLLDGIADGVEEMMPGVIRAVESADPVVDALAEGMRRMGDAVGDGLAQLAPHADEAARALNVLFFALEWGTRGAFALVDGMSRLYKVAELVGALINGDVKGFWALATAQDGATSSAGNLSGALPDVRDRIGEVGDEAETAESHLVDMKTAFDQLFGPQLAYDKAILAYRDGLRDMKKELAEGKRTLDENTAAGRENRDAVLDQIDKINNLRVARINNGMAVDEANGKYADELAALKKTLRQMGYNEGEIRDLISAYEDIPRRVATEVWVETATGERQLAGFMKQVRRADGTTITVRTRFTSSGEYIPGVGTLTRRWGGITEYAQDGKLREAQIASPMGPARYGWAEPATGGELFAPKYGDMSRTRALVNYAVENWWGGWRNFAPQTVMQTPTGGTAPIVVENHIEVGGEVVRVVRTEIEDSNRDLARNALAGPRR